MDKLRSDSRWGRLNKAQLNRLDTWLFDEGLTYEEVLKKAQAELGITASLSSLKRYRARAAQQQLLYQLTDGTAIARCPKRADGARRYSHAMASRLAGMKALDMSLGGPGQEKNLVALMRQLVRDGAVQGMIKNMVETRELRREGLELRREKTEFEVTKFYLRNQLKAKKLEMRKAENGPPASACAREIPEKKNFEKTDEKLRRT
jgi:hypothetical protein